jgi:hypothetical protein
VSPLLHSGVSKDAIAEAPSIVTVDGDPDLPAGLRVYEKPVRTLSGTLLDETGGLQLPHDFLPGHLTAIITYRSVSIIGRSASRSSTHLDVAHKLATEDR